MSGGFSRAKVSVALCGAAAIASGTFVSAYETWLRAEAALTYDPTWPRAFALLALPVLCGSVAGLCGVLVGRATRVQMRGRSALVLGRVTTAVMAAWAVLALVALALPDAFPRGVGLSLAQLSQLLVPLLAVAAGLLWGVALAARSNDEP